MSRLATAGRRSDGGASGASAAEGVEGGDVVGRQGEAVDVGVAADAVGVRRLRDDDGAVLEVPAHDDLRGRAAEPLGDAGDDRVVERAAAQGAVALEDDAAVAVALLDGGVVAAAGSTAPG